MDNLIQKVVFKLAVGLGGGGCVVELIKGDGLVQTDMDEYGGSFDDLFHNGDNPPTEPGIYLFEGGAYGSPISDEMFAYKGTFKRLTPSAHWRELGKEDPFEGQNYDADRAQLCRGNLTDDEIANEVFLRPSLPNLTAAKERIRWLSRSLVKLENESIKTPV